MEFNSYEKTKVKFDFFEVGVFIKNDIVNKKIGWSFIGVFLCCNQSTIATQITELDFLVVL